MRSDDPVILRRIQEIEQACEGLRMACGFPELHAPTSRQEGRGHITEDQARTYVDLFANEYPDLTVLVDELTDRGLPAEKAVAVVKHSTGTGAPAGGSS